MGVGDRECGEALDDAELGQQTQAVTRVLLGHEQGQVFWLVNIQRYARQTTYLHGQVVRRRKTQMPLETIIAEVEG